MSPTVVVSQFFSCFDSVIVIHAGSDIWHYLRLVQYLVPSMMMRTGYLVEFAKQFFADYNYKAYENKVNVNATKMFGILHSKKKI